MRNKGHMGGIEAAHNTHQYVNHRQHQRKLDMQLYCPTPEQHTMCVPQTVNLDATEILNSPDAICALVKLLTIAPLRHLPSSASLLLYNFSQDVNYLPGKTRTHPSILQ